MKSIPYFLTLISISAASCVAQPGTPAPARPVRAAAAAAPGLPPVPIAPEGPEGPEGPEEAGIRHEAEKIRGEADKLRIASDQIAKAKFDWVIADPFNERDDANQSLVLSRDLTDGKAQADTEDDLKVMAHILQKASRSPEERSAGTWGIFYRSPFGSSPALRNLYLEGYGAVFFLSVNYSLTPPATKAEEASEPKNDRDTEWENARREISEPHASRGEGGGGGGGQSGGGGKFVLTPANPEPPFDPERVEALQKNLAQALKNASHIRALQKDESVTIVISARNPSGTKPARVARRAGPEAPATPPRPPRLTMRAKKSDIEAFQKDKMTLDEFRKKLTVSIS